MRHCILGAVLSLSFSIQSAATTLDEALAQAYLTNPQLHIGVTSIQTANTATADAISQAWPQVTATAGWNAKNDLSSNDRTSQSTSLSLGLSQLLFDGGRYGHHLNALRSETRSQQHRLVDTEQTVLLNAVTAFMNVLREELVVSLAESNVEILTEQLDATRSRFEFGALPRTDVSLTEARLASVTAELELHRGSLLSSHEIYRAVVGSPPLNLVPPQRIPDLPSTVVEAEDIALRNHPRISVARQNIAAAEAGARRDKLNSLPIVSANVSQSVRRGHMESSDLSAGISATITLFDGGKARSQRKRSMTNVAARRSELLMATALTRQSIRIAYSNWEVANASLEAIEQQIAAAQLALDGVRVEYGLGARSTLDVLNAEQELRTARVNHARASRDVFVAAFTVLAEMGQLTAQYLNLDVEPHRVDVR